MSTYPQKRMNLGTETGSVINHIYSRNATAPKVGNGGTLLRWTDRQAFEVVDIRRNGLEVDIQYYDAKLVDGSWQSEEQHYELKELMPGVVTLVYRQGAWREKIVHVHFEDEYYENSTWEERQALCNDFHRPVVLVKGKTYARTTYGKVSVIFGIKQHYRDPSF